MKFSEILQELDKLTDSELESLCENTFAENIMRSQGLLDLFILSDP